jgi:hypothetical protein
MAGMPVLKPEVLKIFGILFKMVVSAACTTATEIHKGPGRMCRRFYVVVDILAFMARARAHSCEY